MSERARGPRIELPFDGHGGFTSLKGMPVFDQRPAVFEGVARGWYEEVEYNFPTALEPDATNTYSYKAVVMIATRSGSFLQRPSLYKKSAIRLRDALLELFPLETHPLGSGE